MFVLLQEFSSIKWGRKARIRVRSSPSLPLSGGHGVTSTSQQEGSGRTNEERSLQLPLVLLQPPRLRGRGDLLHHQWSLRRLPSEPQSGQEPTPFGATLQPTTCLLRHLATIDRVISYSYLPTLHDCIMHINTMCSMGSGYINTMCSMGSGYINTMCSMDSGYIQVCRVSECVFFSYFLCMVVCKQAHMLTDCSMIIHWNNG